MPITQTPRSDWSLHTLITSSPASRKSRLSIPVHIFPLAAAPANHRRSNRRPRPFPPTVTAQTRRRGPAPRSLPLTNPPISAHSPPFPSLLIGRRANRAVLIGRRAGGRGLSAAEVIKAAARAGGALSAAGGRRRRRRDRAAGGGDRGRPPASPRPRGHPHTAGTPARAAGHPQGAASCSGQPAQAGAQPGAMEPRGGAWQTPNAENLPPQTLRLLCREVSLLSADPPDGIKVFPNDEDVTDLQVAIEGPEGTPYAGGLFRMKLVLGKDFPAAPPKGFFLTKIFHPNVGPSGEICVNVLKRDWRAELGLRHVLLTIKCLLIQPNPESALNEEAARLLLEDFERFAARARLLTDIHARGPPPRDPSPNRDPPPGPSAAPPGPPDGPVPKKHAGDRKAPPKKKGDKKRALRRL
uniref:E2 ubiquitin-conjugating enzyme n=5 Tax=Passeriformes TaxID=9126 RepID=A0A8C3MNJ0_GEOPR